MNRHELEALAAAAPRKMSSIIEAQVVDQAPAGAQCAEYGTDLGGKVSVRVRFAVGSCFYSPEGFAKIIAPATGGPRAPTSQAAPKPAETKTGRRIESPLRNRVAPKLQLKTPAPLTPGSRPIAVTLRSGKTGLPI